MALAIEDANVISETEVTPVKSASTKLVGLTLENIKKVSELYLESLKSAGDVIMKRWQIGFIVGADDFEYGDNGIQKWAQAVGIHWRTLYDCVRLARRYSLQELKDMMLQYASAHGNQELSWTGVRALLQPPREQQSKEEQKKKDEEKLSQIEAQLAELEEVSDAELSASATMLKEKVAAIKKELEGKDLYGKDVDGILREMGTLIVAYLKGQAEAVPTFSAVLDLAFQVA